MKNTLHRIKGFMLPVAIFLMVILASLVGYSMRLSLLANQGSIQDVQGAQAYLAAKAGVEWAAYQVLAPGSTTMQSCPTPPNPFTINGFTVALTCNQTNPTPQDRAGTQNIGMYTITATASKGVAGALDYIERKVTVSLSRCLMGTEECS